MARDQQRYSPITGVRLPPALDRVVTRQAEMTGKTKSVVVREALAYFYGVELENAHPKGYNRTARGMRARARQEKPTEEEAAQEKVAA